MSIVSNQWILLVLKLSLIRMSWSYLPQFVSMLPVLHINFMLSPLNHEVCHVQINLNYAFEFRSEMSHFCVPVLCFDPNVTLMQDVKVTQMPSVHLMSAVMTVSSVLGQTPQTMMASSFCSGKIWSLIHRRRLLICFHENRYYSLHYVLSVFG